MYNNQPQDLSKTFRVAKLQVNSLYVSLALIFLATISCYFLDKKLAYFLFLFLLFYIAIVIVRLWQFHRYAISVNSEGMWNPNRGKAATFIAWKSITDFKRSWWREQLELLDNSGKTLGKISPFLDNIAELCEILLAQSAITKKINTEQKQFTRTYYHLFYICTSVAILILGTTVDHFVQNLGFPILLTSLLLIALFYSYAIAIYRFAINKDHIEIDYIFRKRMIAFSEIEKIRLTSFQNVLINIHSQKQPFCLVAFNSDALTLYYCLTQAVNQYRNNVDDDK